MRTDPTSTPLRPCCSPRFVGWADLRTQTCGLRFAGSDLRAQTHRQGSLVSMTQTYIHAHAHEQRICTHIRTRSVYTQTSTLRSTPCVPTQSRPISPNLTQPEHTSSRPTRPRFDWLQVPPGQRYGDARRHLAAAFLGCIPVFTVPDGTPSGLKLQDVPVVVESPIFGLVHATCSITPLACPCAWFATCTAHAHAHAHMCPASCLPTEPDHTDPG